MTYLFPLSTAVSTVNGWAVCRVTNPLQDCCFSRICSSYDEDSELDVWNGAGLFRIHCFCIDWRATESGIDLKRLVHTGPRGLSSTSTLDLVIFHSRYQPNDSGRLERSSSDWARRPSQCPIWAPVFLLT